MKREIKFRAWNKVGKYYVNNVQDAYDGAGPNGPFDSFGDALDDDNYVVEQFTGLKDVNGKEIYIGDVVKVWSDMSELIMEPTVNEIVSEDSLGRPGVFLKPAGPHLIEPCLNDSWSNQFEVIGNIHENPELFEVAEEDE